MRTTARHPAFKVRLWRSLVAHLLQERGVGGSKPLSPTSIFLISTSSAPSRQPAVLHWHAAIRRATHKNIFYFQFYRLRVETIVNDNRFLTPQIRARRKSIHKLRLEVKTHSLPGHLDRQMRQLDSKPDTPISGLALF
jgi:hypothetical protein